MTAGTLVAQRFRVLKIFGKGGMGAVYEVEDTHTSTIVALKTLRTDLYDREDLVKRFEREARAAARIGHPNIIQVYAVGHDDALPASSSSAVSGCSVTPRRRASFGLPRSRPTPTCGGPDVPTPDARSPPLAPMDRN